jgi:hypothetical protein
MFRYDPAMMHSLRTHAPVAARRSAPAFLAAALVLASGCAQSLDSIRGGPAYAVIDGERAPVPDLDMGSEETLYDIYVEGTDNSEVMDHLSFLTQTIGPRLTGSTSSIRAERWAVEQFANWGLDAPRRERWGDIAAGFDRGNSYAEVVRPIEEEEDAEEAGDDFETVRPLEFTTLSWTTGTDGPVAGRVVRMPESLEEADLQAEDLTGAWVLVPSLYGNRRGVRSVGFQMRDRSDTRHAIRTGELDPFSPEAIAAAMGEEPEEADPVTRVPSEGQSTWVGSFSYRGSQLPATLILTRNDEGDITQGAFSIEQFHSGPIANAEQSGADLTFDWGNPMGTSSIKLALAADGALVGSSGDGQFPIRLTADDAQDRAEAREIASAPPVETPEMILAHVLERDPAGFISASTDERVWTTRTLDWKEASAGDLPTDVEINVRRSDYDYINSRLADGQDVFVRADLPHTITEGPIDCYNVIAEIRGTEMPDEVVIVSAHLDSWDGPGSQGTVDNATGCSVTLEAARILAAVDAKPKRTIKFILWTGEEQGLWGSREYVAALSDAERARISAVFVDDGGTNYEGGLPAAENMVDFLAAATAPTNGLFFSEIDYETAMGDDDPANDAMAGYMNVNIRNTGRNLRTHSGSDHAPFNRVGIPGFFWDEVGRADYRAAWHTQNDTFDQAIEEYLVQSAVNAAMTAYRVANAPTLVPRDPGPEENSDDQG